MTTKAMKTLNKIAGARLTLGKTIRAIRLCEESS